ncbi:hypothetical protein EAL2_c19980 [Peptoclostridium acidaminophilum DSM 3953]|uniref:RNA polymerase sigma factor 70 region 4 type 2 domain-containing protein n=1 Tax=Peptoclostridium acidaminophilum DSM 3953 TaxID=1286171 RepID=W8T6A3_PEPAC|nr:sigma-70 family RNA polymerase sigma factor [Peptoclostridium acidaminophilum]AHM57279.1 hypothetical protein EAL2_c19980 [Peptoclostridium acidaminophilum DSM 3953]
MKITYEFLTGETVEVEAPDEVGEVLIEIERDTLSSNRKETRRHSSIFIMQEQGAQFEDKECSIEAMTEQKETSEYIKKAIDELLPQQRDLLQKVFYEDLSIAKIARDEGVSEAAVRNRLKKIYKKLEKILN